MAMRMARGMGMRIGKCQRLRGRKGKRAASKRITIFSPFVFAPRNTFCCHNSHKLKREERRRKRPQTEKATRKSRAFSENGGGGTKQNEGSSMWR